MPSPAFPAEIWREILRIAVHIPGSLETKWDHSPDFLLWQGWQPSWYYNRKRLGDSLDYRSALRTKLSIVQVSRTWREIGVELLYEYLFFYEDDVECKAMGTIASIFEQHTHKSGYGRATKHIDFPFLVLNPPTLPILMRLLNSCHNLRILTICRDNDQLSFDLSCNPSSISELASLLRFRFSHSLRRMAFNLDALDIAEPEPDAAPHIYLPDVPLESLELATNFLPSREPYPTVSNLTIDVGFFKGPGMAVCHFPSLRHFHLVNFSDTSVSSIFPFLAFHGPQLLSLAVSPNGDNEAMRVPELVRLATNLRSLVFDLVHVESFSIAGPFLSITHIGIRSRLFINTSIPQIREFNPSRFFPKAVFPNLQCLRFLDISDYRHSWQLEIARNFSPIRVETKDCQVIL